MGAASSALNSIENEIAQRELAKPLDASDIADGPAAIEEVIRLRKELRRLMDKEQFKKRKENNKLERVKEEKGTSSNDKEEEEFDLDALNDALNQMREDMKIALEDSPTKERARPKVVEKKSSLDDRLGSFEGGTTPTRGSRTKRRSFVLEKGLELVDFDSDEE
ncbi:hypothetical protein TrLO_g11505 [Triparma laevis f. longispina]|uniref:Uncharacterized protein n=1 Tax=Triparma laevis f. longispina TaxID=1714387 RepID=A0A9W7EJF5_9STRA|nr:hypothetical protein TrLO_g11505 [Triparma laevis f. longispina]